MTQNIENQKNQEKRNPIIPEPQQNSSNLWKYFITSGAAIIGGVFVFKKWTKTEETHEDSDQIDEPSDPNNSTFGNFHALDISCNCFQMHKLEQTTQVPTQPHATRITAAPEQQQKLTTSQTTVLPPQVRDTDSDEEEEEPQQQPSQQEEMEPEEDEEEEDSQSIQQPTITQEQVQMPQPQHQDEQSSSTLEEILSQTTTIEAPNLHALVIDLLMQDPTLIPTSPGRSNIIQHPFGLSGDVYICHNPDGSIKVAYIVGGFKINDSDA